MLSAIWAARYRTPARFVALVALLLPWTTTGVTFALIPWLIAFAFVDLARIPAFAAPPGLPAADRAGRARTCRHALVGCAMAGAGSTRSGRRRSSW